MRVLIVSKTTNLELYGERIRKHTRTGTVDENHLRSLKKSHDSHYRSREALFKALKTYDIRYEEVGRGLYWPDLAHVDWVVTLGGDGTILEASHHIHNDKIPILGIRSSEQSVGHLCFAGQNTIDQTIRDLAENKLTPIEVSRLRAEVELVQTNAIVETDPVLNDFLFSNFSPAATTRYVLKLGSHKEEQKSSGIWVATPAGSTAAIHAAGGTPVSVTEDRFQFFVRELFNSPHESTELLQKGVFDPDHDKFSIENHCEKAMLATDGQHGFVRLEFGDKVTFKRGPKLKICLQRLGL